MGKASDVVIDGEMRKTFLAVREKNSESFRGSGGDAGTSRAFRTAKL
jgi:hypothetical protein